MIVRQFPETWTGAQRHRERLSQAGKRADMTISISVGDRIWSGLAEMIDRIIRRMLRMIFEAVEIR